MSALTRRYIDQVTAHLPDGQRGDIARELEALTADMTEERLAAGADAPTAEREVLEELGDPARLAATYRSTPAYLIGPELYPVYVRALQWILPLVLLVALVVNIVEYSATEPSGQLGAMIGAVVGPVVTAFLVALGTVTALFWLFERFASSADRRTLARDGTRAWSVDALETDVVQARDAQSEAVVNLVFVAMLAFVPVLPTTFLYVGHLNGDGSFVNQGLWDFWIPAYYVLLAVVAAQAVWTLVRRGTSRPQIVVRAVTDVAAAVFFTALVLTQEVIDPAIDSGILQTSGGEDWVDALYVVVIWLVAAWDLYMCWKYWRSLPS